MISEDARLEEDRSNFEYLKKVITKHRPKVIRVGLLRKLIIQKLDGTKMVKNENGIEIEVYGETLQFYRIGDEVLKWLEELGYKKDPKTEGPVENDPFVYKEFFMYIENNETQNSP